jgi:DNA-binding transcriptional ArsR family regulator
MPLLRSRVQGSLLALLYLHPEQDYSLSEAASAIDASVRAVHDEADRLTTAGLVIDSRRGTSRLIRAATDTPVARALTDLLAVTYGPLPVLTDMLSGVPGIMQAFIYGSWAARYSGEPGPVPNDVDVLVIGDVNRSTLYKIAENAQRRLGREVNAQRVPPDYWENPDPADSFLKTVREQPLVELKVTP